MSGTQTRELIALAALARECGVPVSRLRRILSVHRIVPDAVVPAGRGSLQLFRSARIAQIRGAVADSTTPS
jgi:hypothetical protein